MNKNLKSVQKDLKDYEKKYLKRKARARYYHSLSKENKPFSMRLFSMAVGNGNKEAFEEYYKQNEGL